MNARNSSRRVLWMITAILIAMPFALQAAKPVNVTVTAANPADATQGEELDVIVTGSGFDSGSSVSYLVTGTTDASQVAVQSVQFISSTQLKTRIKVNGNAPATGYDIEVRISTGRKGKGTTLFRVKSAEDACNEEDPKEPTIAYLTEFELLDGINSADIILSNASGCDQQLLVEGAFQYLPDTPQNAGVNRFIRSVRDLRFARRGSRGVVTWHNGYQHPWAQLGVIFEVEPDGTVIPETSESIEFYRSDVGDDIWDADVRISSAGDVILAMVLKNPDENIRTLSTYNYDTGEYNVISSGTCQVLDSDNTCYVPSGYMVRWDPLGDAIYFSVEQSIGGYGSIIARVNAQVEGWSVPAAVLEKAEGDSEIYLESVSASNLLVFAVLRPLTNKRGKHIGSEMLWGILDLQPCAESPCLPSDAFLLPENRGMVWTSSDSLLLRDNSGQNILVEYVDPISGLKSNLSISNVSGEYDSDL